MTGTKVLVTIPLELYRVLEQKCELESLEFRMLKSGLIVDDGAAIAILFKSDQALGLIAWANQHYRNAALQINVARDLN
jgi:hypothetical protein